MDQILDNINKVEKPAALTDKEIFTQIWLSPRKVFKFTGETGYGKYTMLLLVFIGISKAFDRASLQNYGDDYSMSTILAICIIAGGLLGWISYYLYSALLSWTGKWLGGQADTDTILYTITYGSIPTIVALIFLVPQIALFDIALFQAEGDLSNQGLALNIAGYAAMAIEFILGIWSLVLCVVGISEVQKISIAKAILNLILPFIVIFTVIMLIIFLVWGGQ